MTNRRCSIVLIFFTFAFAVSVSPGMEVGGLDDSALRRGIAFSCSKKKSIEKQIAFKSAPGSGEAVWSGFLESQVDGDYRIAALVKGKVVVKVNGRLVLLAEHKKPTWVSSDSLHLEFDRHSLSVSLKAGLGHESQLTLFWSGPGFRFEPIPPRQLYHRLSDGENTGHNQIAEIVRALRCQACHTFADQHLEVLRSPSLTGLHDNLIATWLMRFLSDAPNSRKDQSPDIAIQNMHGGFSEDQASDIAAYLEVDNSAGDRQPLADENGKELFLTIGCLGCHGLEDLGESSPLGGGKLDQIATKRPSGFFDRWLKEPERVNLDHRMPVYDLSDLERMHLSAFLKTCGSIVDEIVPVGDKERGKRIVQSSRCGACHRLPGPSAPSIVKTDLNLESDWSQSCLSNSRNDRPNYGIHDKAIQASICDHLVRAMDLNELSKAEQLLRDNNCFGCHPRDESPGIVPTVQRMGRSLEFVAERIAVMRPPSLNSIGDKFHRVALEKSILRTDGRVRPWLSVRMPKFVLKQHEVKALVDYFIHVDRVPEKSVEVEGIPSDNVNVGERLVTADGFGCTSCHGFNNKNPDDIPPGARGPDLGMIGTRIRRNWFERWVRNPIRIVPNMEMPSVQIPIRGILGDDLDRQLHAIWHVMNQSGFQPPDSRPIRIVRGGAFHHAVVLTDVLNHQGEKWVKPFLVGLSTGHNILFDLDRAALVGWWAGDTAIQRTKGKTWFWQSGSDGFIRSTDGGGFELSRKGKRYDPIRVGQFTTEVDAWAHVDDGVEFDYRLSFQIENDSSPHRLHVTERITSDNGNSWNRSIRVSGMMSGDILRVDMQNLSPYSASGKQQELTLEADSRGTATIEARFEVSDPDPIERPIVSRSASNSNDPKRLDVLPGFATTRLALREEIMPTGFAWQKGLLLISSLKGRVWLASDTDFDGLEDNAIPISDELAAPYGLHAEADYVDVITKYGLLRMQDFDGDRYIDRTQLVASGWGHTADYHDWVVGLPRDEEGNYYVAVPCQQDFRSTAAAYLRGTILRLTRTEDMEPRLFKLEQTSAGHRFPMGLARDPQSGRLFATDNQGNYNPFNELNHVVSGARFGFINKMDLSTTLQPMLTPPAIDIPHPWTRSVNGICFLTSPHTHEHRFGPFEGHLVGCEYDSRRLIRMSLEEVDGWLQGAAYPFSDFSINPDAESFQGPICCAVSPSGDLYVGNMRDSGWGGANNTGSITRSVPLVGRIPTGIAEVSAIPTGFRVVFTKPVDAGRAADVENYSVHSYRRVSTPAYGGEDQDRRAEKIKEVRVRDPQSIEIHFEGRPRIGFVWEIRIKDLTADGSRFFPAEAHYTLRRLPN